MGERTEVMDLLARSLRAAIEDPCTDLSPEVQRQMHDAVVRFLEWQRRDNGLEEFL